MQPQQDKFTVTANNGAMNTGIEQFQRETLSFTLFWNDSISQCVCFMIEYFLDLLLANSIN